MKTSVLASTGIEMSADPLFLPRVRRLARVSAVALGIIWFLAVTATESHSAAIDGALFAGWILMPTVLWASIPLPRIRPLVFVPSALVTVGLVVLCITALPGDTTVRLGWLLITGGILFGGVLGAWFWFRWLPVPASLDAPFSPGRWTLIGAHVAMIVAGMALVALGHYF